MRPFLVAALALLVVPLLLAPTVQAQRPVARVYLKSGKVVEGPLLKANDDRVVLRLPDMEITISAADIERVVPISGSGADDPLPPVDPLQPQEPTPAPTPAPDDAHGAVGDPSAPTAVRSAAAGAARGTSAGGAPGRERRSSLGADPGGATSGGPDSHFSSWLDRYLWLIPQSGGHRASLGAGLLLVLVLILHWSAKVAGVEAVTFARSCAIGAALFLALIVQLSLDVESPVLLGAMLLANVLLYYVLARLVLGAGLLSATVMQVCSLLSCLLVVLAIEVMGYVLQQHDHVT